MSTRYNNAIIYYYAKAVKESPFDVIIVVIVIIAK